MPQDHTILVVDDEPDVVKSVQDLLRLDYRVLGATGAEEGLRLLDQEDVHVVMSDQRMPDLTGVEFLSRVRERHPDAIRLLFTGYSDIPAVVAAINQGQVYRYITKPWDPAELQAIIRESIGRYELIAERQRLLDELHQKNEELERKNTELRQANDLKRAFISVASHELHTPLMILVGMVARLRALPELPAPVPEWLARVQTAAERLQQIVGQLLTMLEVGELERPLVRSRVDLMALLEQAIDEVRPFVELRRQHLATEITADLGSLCIDRGKIRDGIAHLLINAIKFTPDGGHLSLSARRTEGGVEIRVSDTGIGIDAASLARIFEPFFTGFDTSQHASGTFEFGRRGLGLGLSVVRAFIEMHGGTVTAFSQPGTGTTILIRLPDQAGC